MSCASVAPQAPAKQEDLDCAPLQAQLESLRLKVSSDMQKEITMVLESLADIISTRIYGLVSDSIDSEEEAKMWSCFAQVYQLEVEAYCKRKGQQPSMNRKRQIFADILVWAEVTRPGYDEQAAAFVTETHRQDENFQRIGRHLKSVKAQKGVTKL